MKISFALFALLLANKLNAQQENFPKKWLGNWKGELQWFRTGKEEPQVVKMELRIAATDTAGTYTWQMIYGEAGKDNRPYLLKLKDPAKAHWMIDEQNGIVLDQFWVGHRFCGAFTVMGNTIINSYWIEKDELMVEFFSIPSKAITTTGNGTEQSPNVDSYRVGSYQKAVLKKE